MPASLENVPEQVSGNDNGICDYCHQKLKSQNFDFCGETCASLAQSGGNSQQSQPSRKAPDRQPNASGNNNLNLNSQNGTIMDPIEVAKLVIQQIPLIQALLQSPNPPRLVFHSGPPPGTAQTQVSDGNSLTNSESVVVNRSMHNRDSNSTTPGNGEVLVMNICTTSNSSFGPTEEQGFDASPR